MSEEVLFRFVSKAAAWLGLGEITVILIGIVAVTFIFLLFWFKFAPWLILKMGGEETEILMTGAPGNATILQAERVAGIEDNGQRLELTLRVAPQRGAEYQARARVDAPAELVDRFKSGAVFPVKISQADPRKVVLDLDDE
ncbi:MAG: hypothetical protein HZB29_03615 [Nitrospinae bacterium]|nr:hypothetical protein [Nitrospinota bacterium]